MYLLRIKEELEVVEVEEEEDENTPLNNKVILITNYN